MLNLKIKHILLSICLYFTPLDRDKAAQVRFLSDLLSFTLLMYCLQHLCEKILMNVIANFFRSRSEVEVALTLGKCMRIHNLLGPAGHNS